MKDRFISLLRWSEKYTKTDMLYLAQAGWWINLNVVMMAVLALLLSITFANLLTPTAYGLYQYLLSLSVLVAAISLAGMNGAVAQATARGYEGVLRAAVRVQLKWSVIPFLSSIGGAWYYFTQGNLEVSIGLIAIAILTPLSNTFNTYVGLLEGKRAFRQMFYLGSIVNIASYTSLFITVLLVKNGVGLLIVNLVVNTLAMAYAYYRTLAIYQPNDRIDPEAIPYGKHLSVMTAFTTIMNQLDSILVFHYLGAAPLAVYSLATMLPKRVGTLFSFIGSATMPRFANHPIIYIRQHLFGKLARIAAAAIVLAFVYAIATPLIFKLLFPRYLSAISFSMTYAPTIVLLALASVVNAILMAKRFTREIYVLNFVQPLLLIGLEIPLLLAYGIFGMIFARLASDAFGICLSLFFIYKPLTKEIEKNLPK